MSVATRRITRTPGVEKRVAALDWQRIASDLDAYGCAIVPGLLASAECKSVEALYATEKLFRSRIVMARHGYGRGEYQYFAYPLPALVATLRAALYPGLASIANAWNAKMNVDTRYPDNHSDFLARCHRAGQTRPTP
ncbi:MAG TPA: 2OG-Fe(II) oxygenase, partial [Burkholderiales bacterium]|nr:2OG-Fe(II) oxygenase [Burkholderiales bacterium]